MFDGLSMILCSKIGVKITVQGRATEPTVNPSSSFVHGMPVMVILVQSTPQAGPSRHPVTDSRSSSRHSSRSLPVTDEAQCLPLKYLLLQSRSNQTNMVIYLLEEGFPREYFATMSDVLSRKNRPMNLDSPAPAKFQPPFRLNNILAHVPTHKTWISTRKQWTVHSILNSSWQSPD
jgi:hypothetical protein